MCTGKCSRFIGISLYPLVVFSIVCNVIMFFPGWETDPIRNPEDQMTPEVLYLGGVIGSGLLVLIPAIHIQATGRQGCCNNRCGRVLYGHRWPTSLASDFPSSSLNFAKEGLHEMFLSIIFAAIGVVGSLYGFVVSIVGMVKGPVCQFWPLLNITHNLKWGRPFDSKLEEFSDNNYLFNRDLWKTCIYPEGVVEFNVILFSMVLAASGISLVLCGIQMINGLFGCLCGTCRKNDLE